MPATADPTVEAIALQLPECYGLPIHATGGVAELSRPQVREMLAAVRKARAERRVEPKVARREVRVLETMMMVLDAGERSTIPATIADPWPVKTARESPVRKKSKRVAVREARKKNRRRRR